MKRLQNDFFEQVTAFGGMLFFVFILVLVFLFSGLISFIHLLVLLFSITIISSASKIFLFKHRPKKQRYSSLLEKIDAGSFPSVHAMRVGALATFFSSQNYILSALIWIFALLICYSRIYLKKHYWVDILVGLLLGIFLTIGVLFLWKTFIN